jgi:inner membrane protein involved in colicin E2 resistance
MKKIIFILFAILSFSACKTQKTQAEKVETKEETNPHLQQPEGSEADAWIEKTQKSLPDSLFAQIQRTACFGRCPIYTLSVYESGYVEYLGKKWVEKEGRFAAEVDQKVLDKLMKEAKAINYFDLNHQFDSKNVTDLPSTITTLKGKEGFHIVVNRYQAPEELSEFAHQFDQLFKDVKWEKIPMD